MKRRLFQLIIITIMMFVMVEAGLRFIILAQGPASRLQVSPAVIAVTQTTASLTTHTLWISNTGLTDLDWGIQETGAGKARPITPVSMTHSLSQTILVSNSVSCNSDGFHNDNSYMRVFDLNDFGLPAGFEVSEVQIGIERAIAAGGQRDQPAMVKLYRLDGPLLFANMSLIVSASVSINDQSQSILSVPLTATVAGNSVLVAEFFTPNGQTSGHSLYVGSNNLGQSAPSYIAAPDCGAAEPTDTATLGFANMQIVLNVLGHLPTCKAKDIPWLTNLGPLSGTLSPGAQTAVQFNIDSTGLNNGLYANTLCLESNDPLSPALTIPLNLNVYEPPNPSIALTKTLSADGSCGSSNQITVTGSTNITYCYTVQNAGNITFTIHSLLDDQLGMLFSDIPYLLAPGKSYSYSHTVEISATTVNSATWNASISGTLAYVAQANALATVTVQAPPLEYGVTVIAPPGMTGNPGDILNYSFWITNTGNQTDSFSLSATGVWTPTTPASVGPLAAATGSTVNITVAIPLTASNGASDTTILRATSQGDGLSSGQDSVTTVAIIQPVSRAVVMKAPINALSGAIGASVTYTVFITNTGNITDTFSLTSPATLQNPPGPLASGKGAQFSVVVAIPPNASNGYQFTAPVTATSQGDSAVSAAVILTTTAVIDMPILYLPLILKFY